MATTVWVDALATAVDPADVVRAVGARRGGATLAAPRDRWFPLAARIAATALPHKTVGAHELAVATHLAAMVAHTFNEVASKSAVVDTSPLLVKALIATELQNVCGFDRSAEFQAQLELLAAAVQIDTSGVYVLLAGPDEEVLPDYEQYTQRAAHYNVDVIIVDPNSKTADEVASEICTAAAKRDACAADYL